jgi:hypothetical protein
MLLSWPPELQGFQLLSATNVAGPWQSYYYYTDDSGSRLVPRLTKEFFRLQDLEVP